MNARQAAEYRDELARRNIALRDGALQELRDAEKARPKRTYRRKQKPPKPPVPPRSEKQKPATKAEAELAARLLPHCAVGSVIDRQAHALNVARTVLALRRKYS